MLVMLGMAHAAAHAQTQDLTVSAAASLTNAFEAIAPLFEKAHPGVKVRLNFAASGPLLQQIQQGAPVDVFASADQDTMQRAAAAALIDPKTRQDFAANTLVLIVPSAATATPASLRDLTGAAYKKIAIGNPATVPVGRYTQEAIDAAGLGQELAPRWVNADSVRQVLNYVARGEVDAGFVYRTDALIEKARTRVAFTVPTRTPITYPIAQVAASKQAARARDFIAFVRSPAAQDVLTGFGFAKP